MTKKHYQLIAKVFSDYLDDGDNDQLDGIGGAEKVARELATALEQDNPNFDRERFLKAMGLTA
jgi:hypothetical protein